MALLKMDLDRYEVEKAKRKVAAVRRDLAAIREVIDKHDEELRAVQIVLADIERKAFFAEGDDNDD